MNTVARIRKMLKDDRIKESYAAQNRLIMPNIYHAMKAKRQCAKCEKKGNIQIHHIIPVSKGGSNERSNLIALCEACHRNR